MPQTEAQARAKKKYHDKFDDIKVRVPKGERQVWQEHAAGQEESLNGFICRAVAETMERDRAENSKRP
jgi:predicted HicB family RNase H-like nuclease